MVPKVPKTLSVVDGLSITKNIKMKNAMVQKTRIEKNVVTLIHHYSQTKFKSYLNYVLVPRASITSQSWTSFERLCLIPTRSRKANRNLINDKIRKPMAAFRALAS